jgi:hypothetical protein
VYGWCAARRRAAQHRQPSPAGGRSHATLTFDAPVSEPIGGSSAESIGSDPDDDRNAELEAEPIDDPIGSPTAEPIGGPHEVPTAEPIDDPNGGANHGAIGNCAQGLRRAGELADRGDGGACAGGPVRGALRG